MSETLCTLRGTGGGGGRYKETTLWTNSAPTSDFTAQAITLSSSIGNYKYIAINYAYATSYSTGVCNTSVVISVDDFRDMGYNTSARHNIGAMGVQNQSNSGYTRTFMYVDDTTIRFGTCYQASSSTSSNGNCIPLEILGLNELQVPVGTLDTKFREAMVRWAVSGTTSYFGRIWDTEYAQDGDTLSGVLEGDYIISTEANSVVTFKAKAACKAIVMSGGNSAVYHYKDYAAGDTFATITRNTNAFIFVGIL